MALSSLPAAKTCRREPLSGKSHLAFIDPHSSQPETVLPPMALDHHPLTMAMDPLVGDPVRVGMGRTLPAARNPDVVVARPALVAVDPHKSSIRRRTGALIDGSRRPHANRHLRKSSRGKQSKSQQRCQCNLFHDKSTPPWVEFPVRVS